MANTDPGPFATAGQLPGHAGEGQQHKEALRLPHPPARASRAAGGCAQRFVHAGGGREMNRQPRPHAKRLPYIRSVSTATKQRSWPRGSRDARIPSTGDHREVGTQPACSHVHCTPFSRPLRAALISQGTHMVCFNDWDSLFKKTVHADDSWGRDEPLLTQCRAGEVREPEEQGQEGQEHLRGFNPCPHFTCFC